MYIEKWNASFEIKYLKKISVIQYNNLTGIIKHVLISYLTTQISSLNGLLPLIVYIFVYVTFA